MPDPEVARRTSHTLNAVHLKRRNLNIPAFRAAPVRGTSYEPRTGKWYANISIDGRVVHLGTFRTEAEAHRSYMRAALERDRRRRPTTS